MRTELEQYRRASDRMRKMDPYRGIRNEAEKRLKALTRLQNEVIRMRYFRRMEWVAVSMELHYSLRQIHRLHRQAIRAMEEADNEQSGKVN